MQKFIFKKDGEDNQIIVEKIINFITTNWSNSPGKGITMVVDKKTVYPCKKMLYKDHCGWIFIDAFDATGLHRNHVLQFTTGEYVPPCDQEAIWVGDNAQVAFADDNKSFEIRNFDGRTVVIRKI
jgi:hypothetical protein